MTTPTVGSLEKRIERLERNQAGSNARHEEAESRLGILDGDGVSEDEPVPYQDHAPGYVEASYALYGDSDKTERTDRSDTGPDGGLDLVSSRGYIAIHRDHNERYHLTSPRLRRGLSDSIRILDPVDLRTLADAIEEDRASRTGGESEADAAHREFIQRSKERLRR